jgi:hypothetical protein
MQETLDRLETAIRHGHTGLALTLIEELRRQNELANEARSALEATVECAFGELGENRDLPALQRFLCRIEAGRDPDSHL